MKKKTSDLADSIRDALGVAPEQEKVIRILFGTDFHFGSTRTPSLSTLRSIKHAWPDSPEMAKHDLFIIGGDWMDRLINLSQQSAYEAQEAAIHILTVCKKYDIKLRIVEGTCSHDRRQSIMFTELNTRLEIGCDLKYFQDLAIEFIDDLNLTVLYLPDEWHHDSDETLRQAQELIKANGLQKVDIAVVHGGFKYQFPLELPSLHDEVAWSELVNYAILSGHIHAHSRCLKVICGGSFNRNNHDEDGPKGHIRLEIAKGRVRKVDFVDNPYAKIYKTINIFDLDIQDVLEQIAQLGSLPDGSAIRLEYRDPDPIKAIRETVEAVYPRYIFSDVKRVEKKEKELRKLFSGTIFQPVEITRNSVVKLVVERLAKKGNGDDVLALATKAINETIEEGI
ncbi:hypothetical protein [Serratia phage PCH45]|uniref:hypothetical protein n=1 Tax=Serratia phage PCH45 TaxID=2608368 RepID=UPI0012A80094|nr:hypothetical protein [Serratia phage PCH45]